MRRTTTTLAASLCLLIAGSYPAPARGACGDEPGDDAAVAMTRAAIDSACECAGATSHAAFVACAGDVIASRIADGRLPADCERTVRRCARKSTCGRPGAVTCCRSKDGRSRCAIKRDATRCRAPRGGQACVSTASSCCEACDAPPCISTTTSTTTSTTSSTVAPCGGTYPLCNGDCPTDSYCTQNGIGGTSCVCVSLGLEACGGGTYPTCDGTCTGTGVCAPVTVYLSHERGFNACACVDPTSNCSGSFQDAMCPGLCPPETRCAAEPEPANLGGCLGCLPLFIP